ncbi:hypothetical protein [Vibrio vulnificus]|uniref:hypothetical protein n=1 Tax=Vibrio vulnificus TaxID=672 RepID=UPI0010290E43|nr:hypothetical protein [Vibrio vulnificus]RZP88961.1 hypothetical protein D8T54_20250 [Vibrio vulnificus]
MERDEIPAQPIVLEFKDSRSAQALVKAIRKRLFWLKTDSEEFQTLYAIYIEAKTTTEKIKELEWEREELQRKRYFAPEPIDYICSGLAPDLRDE